MSNPWEDYQNNEESGPWSDFSSSEPDHVVIPGTMKEVPVDSGKNKKFSQYGLGEAAVNLGTGLGAFFGGLGTGAYSLLSGKSAEEADKAAGETMQKYTYQPKTDEGQRYAENVGEFINHYLIPGAGLHFAKNPTVKRINGIDAKLDELKKEIPVPEAKPWEDYGPSNEILPSNAPQYGIDHSTGHEMWTMDKENHPYRADLSMDNQLMQEPLQRNLWGEDMVNAAGADKTLHQAMDEMAAKGGEIPEAVNKLKEEIPADEQMQQAHYDNSDIAREGPFSVPKSQGGYIDLKALEDENQKVKFLPNGVSLLLRGQEGVGAKVEAYDQHGNVVGEVRLQPNKFNFTKDDNLQSGWTQVNPEYRGKGLAEEMYKFASEHAGDIVPSETQTSMGKQMWDGFERRKVSRDGMISVPRGQRGAINADIFKPGFEKEIDDPQRNVKYVLNSRPNDNPQLQSVVVKAIDKRTGEKVAEASFGPKGENVYAWGVETIPEKRRQGIATGMYDALRSTGTDIVPSTRQSADGKAFWSNRQKGNVDVKAILEGLFGAGKNDLGTFRKQIHEEVQDLIRRKQLAVEQLDKIGYWQYEPGDQLYSKTTGKTYTITGKSIGGSKKNPYPVYYYGQGDYINKQGDYSVGTFNADKAQDPGSSLTKIASVPRNQRGAIDIGEQKKKFVADRIGEKLFAADPKPENVIQEALAEGKDGNGINYAEAGGTLTAMKRQSSAILAGSRWAQSAGKRAEANIRDHVFPAEQQLKRLSKNEIIDLAKVFKAEMFDKLAMTPERLAQLGLSNKQLDAYAKTREMFKQALDVQNQMRQAQGLEPISPQEYYLSSRWQGDFRRPVMDQEGRLKWYLAADSKSGLDKQFKALKEEFPDLVAGEDHTVRSGKPRTELESLLTQSIDILGRDDPAVERISQWVQEQIKADAANAFNQQKHFENKANIRGFIGDRPGMDPHKESAAMFAQQILYAKNAFKWAELQKAGEKFKELLSNPELQQQQPNNMKYLRDYWKEQTGTSEAKWVAALENNMREAGISPALVNRYINNVKGLWIMQKIGVSAGYLAANVLQYGNAMPHLVDINPNPVVGAMSIVKGIPLGMVMALGHYAEAAKKGIGYESMRGLPEENFYKRAFKYAEDNGVTARSVYDESPLSASFFDRNAVASKVKGAVETTLTAPEAVLRSTTFMTFVEQLKASKEYANDLDLFREAEERTNAAMVDYRQGERAMAFKKLGTFGNALNTLQTYPVNFYQQWNYFARQAMKGNVLPLIALLGVQGYLAGFMGMPGFSDIDKLITYLKGKLPPEYWAKVKDFDLKRMILDMNLGPVEGADLLYGGASNRTGVALTSRVSAPDPSEMLQAPGGAMVDFAKQMGDVASLGINPNKTNAAQAALDIAPTGLQGLLETTLLRDQTSVPKANSPNRIVQKTTDLASHVGMYERTPGEESIRRMGLRSQREQVEKDLAYSNQSYKKQADEKIKSIPDRFFDAVVNNQTERAANLYSLYVELSGNEISREAINKQIMDQYTTALQRSVLKNNTLEALKSTARVKAIIDDYNSRHPK